MSEVMLDVNLADEPERYELREAPAYDFPLARREFLEFAGAGLLLTLLAPAVSAQRGGATAPSTVSARLHLGEDGLVTVLTGKVEVGQGARTELAMAAAEELRLPLTSVRVTMADTALVPNDGITAGSRSTPSTVPAVRKAAAAARRLLDEASTAAGKKMSYADLARSTELAAKLKSAVPSDVQLTALKDWQVLGKPHWRTDGRAIVTGEHRFPSDIVRPGMLYGSVLRAPQYNSTLTSVDTDAAKNVSVVRDGNFVACAAPTSYAARKAMEAIAQTAKWDTKSHPSSNELFTYLKANASTDSSRQPRVQSRGSVENGLAQAKHRVRASYQVPFIQHAPMEPRAAVAEWQDDKLTLWTGTQNPHGVRDQLVQAFHLSADKVRVIVPDTGGGFGGKHTGETAIEAARIARQAGKPVCLRWTRGEEFQWAYFRPAGLFEIEGGVDDKGLLTAWDFTNYNAGTAAMESPYRSANSQTKFVYCQSPLREGSYRGIAATANTFARECFMDELAAAAGKDPLEFRLANLDNSRLRDVLTAAAKKFGWPRKVKMAGRGIGIAGGTEKGSYVAACAEVDVRPGAPVRIVRFVMAYECGAILNPANLMSQVEGSVIQGLGGALTEEIQFSGGKLLNGSFTRYPVPRFRDVPPIEIELLDRKDLESVGAGETPIIAVAPAVANAVSDATGKRARAMPVRGLMKA